MAVRRSVIDGVLDGNLYGWECSTFLDRRRWSQRCGDFFVECGLYVILGFDRCTKQQVILQGGYHMSVFRMLQDSSDDERRSCDYAFK